MLAHKALDRCTPRELIVADFMNFLTFKEFLVSDCCITFSPPRLNKGFLCCASISALIAAGDHLFKDLCGAGSPLEFKTVS